MSLQLNFLGELTVIRDGDPMSLPPSRKTRALLAYLALNNRQFHREHLCELLWELPDDPRGSLRWSLSKIRQLVDLEDEPHIIADRNYVRFDPSYVSIDVTDLYALAASNLEEVPLEVFERAVDSWTGDFLEGLELINFYHFHSWCLAEREKVARARTKVLNALIQRLAGQPEKALQYARALVLNSPYDESARAQLIRLLVTTGHGNEAEEQYEMGRRLLKEIGAESSGLLFQAWRGAPGQNRTKQAPPPQVQALTRPSSLPVLPTAAANHDLVGRGAEWERLTSTFNWALQHQSNRFVLIWGVPGIGKSRLLASFSAFAREAGAFLLEASAFESEILRPLALWIDAFQHEDPQTAEEILSIRDADNRDRLFAALRARLGSDAGQSPVVVVFDDLQWADESSAAALHYLSRTYETGPLVGVLAARLDEVESNSHVQQLMRGLRHAGLLEEIRLGPLSVEAIRQLLKGLAADDECEQIAAECSGNPLLAIELARALSVGERGGSLAELIRERMSHFDPAAIEVLHWAAVLAPRIEIAALERVTGASAETLGDVLVKAENQALLELDEYGFRFSHDLVVQSILGEISPTRRRMMHRRVAELLEQETALDLGRAADLAHHACLSGDAGLAARALVKAGHLCLRFFANEDARKLAEQGLQRVNQLPAAEKVCVTLDLYDILLAAVPIDDWESAAREYTELAEQALDHGALHHARRGYFMAATLRWEHGQWARAREESLQAERVTRSGTEEEQVIGLAETAKCLALLERDLTQADAMLLEARALAARKRIHIEAIPSALGILRYYQNAFDEAEELFKEARTLCKAAGDRINEFQCNEYLTLLDIERGNYQAAQARCQELIELGGKLREGSEAPFARALAGLCHYALEDDMTGFDTQLETLRLTDAKHRLAYVLNRAALLDIERCRPDNAEARAREAFECAAVLERPSEMMMAQITLARICQIREDRTGYQHHRAAVAKLDQGRVASWARKRAQGLLAETE